MSGPDNSRRAQLSVKQAAEILGISSQRVGFYIRRGDLPATTIDGLDYLLQRRDVLKFDRERRSGLRQTTPGRPGPEALAKQIEQRALAASRREALLKQRAAAREREAAASRLEG